MPTCLVCGYPKLKEPPRAPSGGGSYEICPSCGFQYGVDDDDKGITIEAARKHWVNAGMKWNSRGQTAPKGWRPMDQLAKLLELSSPVISKVLKKKPKAAK